MIFSELCDLCNFTSTHNCGALIRGPLVPLNASPTGNCLKTPSWESSRLLKATKNNKLIKKTEIFMFLCSLGKIHIINKIKINISYYRCYYILIIENDITKNINVHVKKKVILPQMLTRTPL